MTNSNKIDSKHDLAIEAVKRLQDIVIKSKNDVFLKNAMRVANRIVMRSQFFQEHQTHNIQHKTYATNLRSRQVLH